MLKKLCNEGFLVSKGNGRGTKYHVNEPEGKVRISESCSERKVESSEGKVESSGQTKKRLSFEDLQAQIITIAQDYVTMEEIAINTQKKLQYLVNKLFRECYKLERLKGFTPECPAILNKNIRQLIRTINKQYEYTANTAFFIILLLLSM